MHAMHDGELLERLLSPDGTARANILLRPDGLLSVEIERLVQANAEFEEPEYWSPVVGHVIVVDNLARARDLATAELSSLATRR
jgi:hypothetical protein